MGSLGNPLLNARSMQPPPSPNQASVTVQPTIPNNFTSTVATVTDQPAADPDEQRKHDLLDQAHERFRMVLAYESEWRLQVLKEWEFLYVDHWDAELRAARAKKPCLNFDLIGPAIDQVVNRARQDPPEPKFYPVGDTDDEETAEILQGMVRNIEEDSTASTAYESAFEPAVQVGRGWWRYTTEFEPRSFKQKIVVKEIQNMLAVYPDPAAAKYDYSDGRFLFFTEDQDEDVFRAENPHSMAGIDFEGIGDAVRQEWFVKGAIRVAEYWYVEDVEETIVELADGTVVEWSQVPEGARSLQKRTETRRVVRGAKICGREILSEWEWLGQYIPFVPVRGKKIMKNGKASERGMVRPAMDANFSYDVLRSRQVEVVGLGSVAPWMLVEGQDEGYEHEWARANTDAKVLHYKAVDVEGKPAPQPSRVHATVDIAGITTAVQFASDDVKSTTQVFDAERGSPGPESSGRAILARQKQGDNAHFNYPDNFARSVHFGAKILLDLIPRIYDEERVVRIVDKDQKAKTVEINKQFTNGKGIAQVFDIANGGPGRFNVTIGVGPSYPTRQREAATMWPQMAAVIPIIQQRAPDIIVRATGLPFCEEIADRIQPPDTKEQDNSQVPPDVIQKMSQMGQMIESLSESLKHSTSEVAREEMKQTAETFRTTIVAEANMAIAAMKTGSQEGLALMNHQLEQLNLIQDRMREIQAAQQANQTQQPAPATPAAAPMQEEQAA